MSRTAFDDGQELTYEDLNAIPATVEKTMLDLLLPQLIKAQENKIFGNGLTVSRVNATTLQIAAGVGIQTIAGDVNREPQRRFVSNKAARNVNIEVPHPTFDRIDLVCIKSALAVTLTGVRRFKELNSNTFTTKEFPLEKDWSHEVLVVQGIEDGGLAVPAVPAGYMRLCEVRVTAVNGIQNDAALTDKRSRFSHLKYDAVVGTESYCTHTSLQLALADENVGEGAHILVTADQLVSNAIVISKANIEIEFGPKVTFTKGGAAVSALSIQASGTRITKGRFSGFNAAIVVSNTANHCFLFAQRYSANTKNVEDNSNTTTVVGEISE